MVPAKRWPRLVVVLMLLLAATAAVTAPASPAAALAAPQCSARSADIFSADASCTNGDPAIPYWLVIYCRQLGLPTTHPLYETIHPSDRTPTTQPIHMTCPFGGFVLFAWTEVGSPPPPPGADLSCESGSSTFFCEVRHELAGVVQIRWTINGAPVAEWDNKTYVSRGCTTGTIVAVEVTNSTGTATDSWSGCRRGSWP